VVVNDRFTHEARNLKVCIPNPNPNPNPNLSPNPNHTAAISTVGDVVAEAGRREVLGRSETRSGRPVSTSL